jgi:dCTP deaminase
MLTGQQIELEIKRGNISISDFDPERINPNSYNLSLDDKIYEYDIPVLDPKKDLTDHLVQVPKIEKVDGTYGYLLLPGHLYIAQTKEYTECKNFIPCISGRSSIGRLGINVHATAGFGDVGFCGNWTLEIFVIVPVFVYPGMEICQIYYHKPYHELDDAMKKYDGKYNQQQEPTASKISREF